MRRARIWKEDGKWRIALTENGTIKFLHRNKYSVYDPFDRGLVYLSWHLSASVTKWATTGVVTNTCYKPYLPLQDLFGNHMSEQPKKETLQ